jgi:hypothetical protein
MCVTACVLDGSNYVLISEIGEWRSIGMLYIDEQTIPSFIIPLSHTQLPNNSLLNKLDSRIVRKRVVAVEREDFSNNNRCRRTNRKCNSRKEAECREESEGLGRTRVYKPILKVLD